MGYCRSGMQRILLNCWPRPESNCHLYDSVALFWRVIYGLLVIINNIPNRKRIGKLLSSRVKYGPKFVSLRLIRLKSNTWMMHLWLVKSFLSLPHGSRPPIAHSLETTPCSPLSFDAKLGLIYKWRCYFKACYKYKGILFSSSSYS